MPVLKAEVSALLGVAILTLVACGGGTPQGTGPQGSGQPTGTSAPTGSGGVPTNGPTQTAGGTAGATATPATTSSGVPTPTQTAGADASDAVAIAGGAYHSCALITNGGVMCWGFNFNGQLGNGAVSSRDDSASPPAYVLGLTSGVKAIAAEGDATCALLINGTAKCWGMGAVGNGATAAAPTPVDVIGLSGAQAIFTGSEVRSNGFCATVAGGVTCWGSAFNSGVTVSIAGVGDATSVGVSSTHSCAIETSGAVTCWGENSYGQLGNGSTSDSSTPVAVVGLTGQPSSLLAGPAFTCALLTNGGISCWGQYPQVDNSYSSSAIAVDLTDVPTGVESLVADFINYGELCVIVVGGNVTCWGSRDDRDEFFVSKLTVKVKSLGLHDSGSCALTIDNKVACYGLAAGGWPIVQGLLASAAAGQTPPPAAGGIASAVSLDDQGGGCVVTTSGGIKCWGNSPGNGTPASSTPVDVLGLTSGVSSVSAANDHKCAITAAGGVKCWGDNTQGQLGNGTTGNSLIPVDVTGLSIGVTAIAVQNAKSCAIASGGALKCWGAGQATPTDFGGITSGAIAVSLAYDFNSGSCVLLSADVKCWTYSAPNPVSIAGLQAGNTRISSDALGGCVVTATGGVKCWTDKYTTVTPAVDFAGLASGVLDVRVSYDHACALLAGGTVQCWGSGNQYGQIGNGTTNVSTTPVDVAGLSGVAAIAVDASSSCAVTTTHELKCWGSGYGTAPVLVPIE